MRVRNVQQKMPIASNSFPIRHQNNNNNKDGNNHCNNNLHNHNDFNKDNTTYVKGFDLSNPDNYDLNVIVSLSAYFNKVSLEYFSRILHSYATEILHLNIPEPEKHYYYRSCMNIYGACLYQMFSTRAKEELSDYIRKKKKYLNATTKFEIFMNKKKPTTTTKSKITFSSSVNKRSITKKQNHKNPIAERLQKNILNSEPVFRDYKLLRYQSHVLGNIAEANILDYLFINYIETPKFISNLNFVSKCFVSSFDKADSMIKKSSVPHHIIHNLDNIQEDEEDENRKHSYAAGSNSDGDDLDDIVNHKRKKNSSSSIMKLSRRSSTRLKICDFMRSSKDLNKNETDNTDISSVDSTHSELLH